MHSDIEPGKLPAYQPKLPSWHYWVYWAGVLCAITAALTAFGIISWKSTEHKYDRIADAYRAQVEGSAGDVEIPERRLYPYSVIPGGVQSAQELRNAIANDPLVAALYANFDLSRAHIIRLAHDREVYVSYRLNGHIYWTKKRLLLRAGETLISDGKHEARTRCGNQISETPVQPVSPAEPTSAMNAPPSYALVAENSATPPILPDQTPSLDPASSLDLPPNVPPPTMLVPGQPISMVPPPYFPIVGGGPPSNPQIIPAPPPVATPEPTALSLLGMGILALGLASTLEAYRKGRKA